MKLRIDRQIIVSPREKDNIQNHSPRVSGFKGRGAFKAKHFSSFLRKYEIKSPKKTTANCSHIIKGAILRLNGFEKFSWTFQLCCLQSVSIFFILNHPCSFIVYYYLFGVSTFVKHYFQVFFNLKLNLSMVKIPQNIVTEPL